MSEIVDSQETLVVEKILEEMIQMVSATRSSMRSNSVTLNRKELMKLLEQALQSFPEELKAARWLLKERKLFIDKVQQEKQDILDDAQKRATELISRVEVVRQAKRQSRQVIADAETEVAKMKYEMDIYCNNQLQRFEEILAKVYDEVQLGREKLQTQTQETIRMIEQQPELDFEQFSSAPDSIPQEELVQNLDPLMQ